MTITLLYYVMSRKIVYAISSIPFRMKVKVIKPKMGKSL